MPTTEYRRGYRQPYVSVNGHRVVMRMSPDRLNDGVQKREGSFAIERRMRPDLARELARRLLAAADEIDGGADETFAS